MTAAANITRMLCLLLAAGTVAGCNLIGGPLIEGERTLSADHVAGTPLRVETANGSVTVARTDGHEVKIVGRIRAVSQERLDAAEIVASRDDDHTLFVRVDWPNGGPWRREGCSFDISIPEAVGVTLSTNNGDLSISDLGGSAELHTTNGNVSAVRHAGPVDGHTTNGNVTASAAGGAVKVATTNGNVTVDLAPGSAGPIDAHATNGSVDLVVGPAFVGQLELATTNGAVRVDESLPGRVVSSSRRWVQLAFGDAHERSTATTTNGTVDVRAVD